MIYVFKVVAKTVEGDKFVSSLLGDTQGVGVDYIIGVESYPKIRNSYLFAFDNQRHAERWMGIHDDNVILYCEATPATIQTPDIILNFPPHPEKAMRTFWNFVNGKTKTDPAEKYPMWPMPKGTVLCKSIKPIHIIH